MFKMLKDFGHTFKKYFDYIMKVSFGELIFHFFELLIIVIISSLIYVPLTAIEDIVWNFVATFTDNISDTFSKGFHLVFLIITFLLAFIAFMYMFTRRYEDIKNAPLKEKKAKDKEEEKKEQKEVEQVDLPKVKDE